MIARSAQLQIVKAIVVPYAILVVNRPPVSLERSNSILIFGVFIDCQPMLKYVPSP
jgi:hypothetical protein